MTQVRAMGVHYTPWCSSEEISGQRCRGCKKVEGVVHFDRGGGALGGTLRGGGM